METVTNIFAFLIICSCLIYEGAGYSAGAPPSDEICASMRPNHPGEPQTSPFPYGVKLESNRVKAGETVNFQISGTKEQPFRGFLVQGRKVNYEKETKALGKFVTSGNDVQAQTINCGGDNNAITHANGEEKTLVKLQWQAPQEKGTYILLTTVVHSGKIYWIRNPSAQITVD